MASPALRWAGSWRTRRAVVVLFGAALLGMIGTVVIGHDPGFLIGLLIIVGSVTAAIGAQRGVHRLIPLPALSYLAATFGAGYVHDRANLVTSKEFSTSFLSWIGSAFFAVAWATVLIMVIAFGRWVMSKRLVSGTLATPYGSPPAAGRTGASPAITDSRGRDSRDSWGQRDSRGGGAPRDDGRGTVSDKGPGGNAFADPRADRGRRGDADAWDGPPGQGDATRPTGNRGPQGGRERNASDSWGGSGQRDSSWEQRPARESRDRQVRRDDRDSHDGREPRDRQPQRRDGDTRYGDRGRDNPRPRPADGPRDLW